MNFHVTREAIAAAQMLAQEEGVLLEEKAMGKILVWERKGADRDRSLLSYEKQSRQALDGVLLVQSTQRSETCWALGCTNKPSFWIYEVGFDRKELKARLDFAQVNSSSIPGPVPGFCLAHIHSEPSHLAERVYWEMAPVQWGYLPTRWFIKFTDASSMRGPIQQINPKMLQPEVKDTYLGEMHVPKL